MGATTRRVTRARPVPATPPTRSAASPRAGVLVRAAASRVATVGSELVDHRAQHGIGGAQVLHRVCGSSAVGHLRAQGWPATAPGTPVLVEYLGWIFISGRISCIAWATAI